MPLSSLDFIFKYLNSAQEKLDKDSHTPGQLLQDNNQEYLKGLSELLYNDQKFTSGSFSIKDYGNVLHNKLSLIVEGESGLKLENLKTGFGTLLGYFYPGAPAYARISSHYSDSKNTQYGIDLKEPITINGRNFNHVLFSKINID